MQLVRLSTRAFLPAAGALLLGVWPCAGSAAQPPAPAATRTLTIETSEVTAPVLAVSPDGRTLAVGALGQLFLLPATGGAAEQVTSGPSYNTDPAFSPDGKRLAFASNRDGSSANVFVLDLATRKLTQLTRERDASRPAWSPDGTTIAYTRSLERDEHSLETLPGFADTGLREPRSVKASGGEPSVLAAPRAIESLFYLPDGRLGVTVRETAAGGGMFQTTRQSRVEALAADGAVTVLATAPGDIGRVALSPSGDAVHYASRGSLQTLRFDGTPPAAAAGVRLKDGGSRVAAGRDGQLYFGDGGRIWRLAGGGGDAQPVAFTASARIEVHPRQSPRWKPTATRPEAAFRAVMAPAMSPTGDRLAVVGGGFLWEAKTAGSGAARRLGSERAFARDPAYSPDGKRLAYAASENGRRELRVLDLASGGSTTLVTVGGATWPLYPSWSPDGSAIVYQHTGGIFEPYRLVVVNVADKSSRDLARTQGSWTARPHFSRDGRYVYYTARAGKVAQLYRVAASGGSPEPLTALSRHVEEGLVSPDGSLLAFRRNSEVWGARLGTAPVGDGALRRFSAEGGRSFSFTPKGDALLLTAGGRVYRQPLDGGTRSELPVRLTRAVTAAPPLLLERARVLDFAKGGFGDETAVLVEGGRIKAIGAAASQSAPKDSTRLDASGRFVIPGLVDLHVHSAWQNQQTNEDEFIAFGVTSVRDTGSSIDVLAALDERSDLTELPAPRYFYSGEIFEGTMPHWGDAFYTIGSEDEARAEVRRLKAWGADFVKVYPSLPWRLQDAMADEARRNGLPIVGHGLSLEELTKRVVWGSQSVEHSSSVFGSYDDVYRLLAAAGTRADLTLSVGGGTLMRASDPAWRESWRVLEFVPEEARPPGQGAGGPMALGRADQTRPELLELFKPRFERMAAARKDGVSMTAGTDSLMGGVFFGLALHWEIAQFADSGMPSLDVLRMATEGAATLVGADADLGTIAAGKLADLVVLDKNPLEDVRNTQQIWRVVKGGRVYDPRTLRPSPR